MVEKIIMCKGCNVNTHSLSSHTYDQINELLSKTFSTILRVEEKSIYQLGEHGLTISELHAVDAIGQDGYMAMKEIASQLGVTMATATVTITKLVDKGYVKRIRPEDDRRKVLVSLTKLGEAALHAHKEFHQKMIDEALSGLNVEEVAILTEALVKIKSFFEAQENQFKDT